MYFLDYHLHRFACIHVGLESVVYQTMYDIHIFDCIYDGFGIVLRYVHIYIHIFSLKFRPYSM